MDATEAELYREAIRAALDGRLPKQGLVLEIASGSGEHVAHLARSFLSIAWQPTDIDPAALAALETLHGSLGLPNLLRPIALDVMSRPWPVAKADAMVCIDFTHTVPWEHVVAVFERAAHVLGGGASLHVFGTFKSNGKYASRAAADLDWKLQQRDPRLGVREVGAMIRSAAVNGFGLPEPHKLQGHGHGLSFKRNTMPPPTGRFVL